jgi:hypothetical protein
MSLLGISEMIQTRQYNNNFRLNKKSSSFYFQVQRI